MNWLSALRRSPVTLTLITVCVLVWLGELASVTFANLLPLLPADLPHYPWTLITSMFAHLDAWPLGLVHIGLNMWALAVLGPGLERMLGQGLFASSYLIGGLGAGVVYVLVAAPPGMGATWRQQWWETPVVGASGALFALFGIVFWARRSLGMSVRPVVIIVAINVAIGFLIPDVAWTEHLGGLATGTLVGYLILRARRSGRTGRLRWWLAALSVVLLSLLTASYLVRG